MDDVIVHTDAAVVSASAPSQSFSWRAAVAGALLTSTTIFILLFLGAGIGLSLFTVANPPPDPEAAQSAITYGALYFLFVMAFGGAVGGYFAGRLMPPVLEPSNEENFLASAHGVASWTLAVIATATVVAISGLSLAGPSLNAAAILGASANTGQQSDSANGIGAYWTDTLLRPAAMTNAPTSSPPSPGTPASAAPAPASAAPAVNPERRAEAGRILSFGLAKNGMLSMEDHDRLAAIISQAAGVDMAEANRRVDDVQMQIRNAATIAAETARKTVRSLSLWLAGSLFLGGFIAAATAVSGRWVDDKARGLAAQR